MKIVAAVPPQSWRTGTLKDVTAEDISERLGFKPNLEGDPHKVKDEWGFTADGVMCGIWDYKGSWLDREYSTFGPDEVFRKLFPDKYLTMEEWLRG